MNSQEQLSFVEQIFWILIKELEKRAAADKQRLTIDLKKLKNQCKFIFTRVPCFYFGQLSTNDQFDGIGMIIYNYNSYYIGQLSKGYVHGYGFFCKNRQEFCIGNYTQNDFKGYSTDEFNCIVSSGKYLIKTEHKQQFYNFGKQNIEIKNGFIVDDKIKFIGKVDNEKLTGDGQIQEGNITRKGLFYQNKIVIGNIDSNGNGYGELFDPITHITYRGDFTQWLLNGVGSVQIDNGQNISATFHNSMLYFGKLDNEGNGKAIEIDVRTISNEQFQCVKCGQFKSFELNNGYKLHGNECLIKQQQHEQNDYFIRILSDTGIEFSNVQRVAFLDVCIETIGKYNKLQYMDGSVFIGEVIFLHDLQMNGTRYFLSGLQLNGSFDYNSLNNQGKIKHDSGLILYGKQKFGTTVMDNFGELIEKRFDTDDCFLLQLDNSVIFTILYHKNGTVIETTIKYGCFGGGAIITTTKQQKFVGYIMENMFSHDFLFTENVDAINQDGSHETKQFFNGWECIGNFDDNGNGSGQMINFNDQTIKQGTFIDGKLRGLGSIKLASGHEARGLFFDDMLCEGDIDANGTGIGVMYDMIGDTRRGQFLNGSLISGQHERECGQIYDGEFINNQFIKGVIRYPNGREIVFE